MSIESMDPLYKSSAAFFGNATNEIDHIRLVYFLQRFRKVMRFTIIQNSKKEIYAPAQSLSDDV